jgi:acetyl-CoA carboxylase biotin carboxylase subunit
MLRALREYSILGVENNLAFFREILDDPQFREGRLDTNFVGDFFLRRKPAQPPSPDLEMAVAMVAAAHYNAQAKASVTFGEAGVAQASPCTSRWLTEGRDGLQR